VPATEPATDCGTHRGHLRENRSRVESGRLPPTDEAEALLAAARELAGEDPAAQAAVALAECGAPADAFISELAEPEMTATETTVIAERAVELARRVGDPLAESAALDALSGSWMPGSAPAACGRPASAWPRRRWR
jgi:hypothetical protein